MTEFQQYTITRLIEGVPSNQHHIIMDIVLRGAINSAEAVAEAFKAAARDQHNCQQLISALQDRLQPSVDRTYQLEQEVELLRSQFEFVEEQLNVALDMIAEAIQVDVVPCQ
jgi:cell division protein FtsB